MDVPSKKRNPKVPEGFQSILESLSYDVLKAQPKELLRFCVENLTDKLQKEAPVEQVTKDEGKSPQTLNQDGVEIKREELKTPVEQAAKDEVKALQTPKEEGVEVKGKEPQTPVEQAAKDEVKAPPGKPTEQAVKYEETPKEEGVEVKGKEPLIPVKQAAKDEVKASPGKPTEQAVKNEETLKEDGVDFNDKEPPISGALNKKQSERTDSGIISMSEVHEPTTRRSRRQGVAAESWDPENMEEHEKVVHPKSDEQKASLLETVKGILLFRCLDADDHLEVVDAMFERKVNPDEDVITCGEPGDNFYVIESGTYDVFVNIDGEMKKVSQYINTGSFGELALMYNTPRAATVKAITEGILWAMSRETFRSIVLSKAFKKRKLYEELLESVDLLKPLNHYDRMSLADALHARIVEKGDPVFIQGETGREMYFIETGSVSVHMLPEDESSETVELCTLRQHQYFGELALLTNNPRAASVYALERTRLAVLDVESFERILGPCQDILQQKAVEYAEQRKSIYPT